MNSLLSRHIARAVMLIAAVCLLLTATGCSTTRRLGPDDILYTGVKNLDVEMPEGEKLADGVNSLMVEAINVKPNNAINYKYRYPFPLGLWVYNNWDNPEKGFKHWIYEKLVAEPVLVSDVRPEIRTKMLSQVLDDNGYFDNSCSYELNQGKNPKKASITYKVEPGPAFRIDSVILLPDTCHLYHLIDSVAIKSTYFKPGSRYAVDSLSQLRVNITNAVRNRGYYYFSPNNIVFLADSTIVKNKIAMKLTLDQNIPHFLLQRFTTGTITTRIFRNQGGGTPDTIDTERGKVIVMRPSHLRKGLIPSCIAFRKGRTFSVRQMNNTQTYLSRLGIFNNIEINVVPDTLAKTPTLNVNIDCTFDTPLEASIEANVASKSNSYLGPGLSIGVTNRNMFGGAEQFAINLTGTYEWQTGGDRGKDATLFNSYEVSLSTSLAFPRLLAPNFIPRRRRQLNWTRIALSGDYLNRPHYFRMAKFNASFAYDWRVSRNVTNSLTLMKLTYTKLLNTTHEFDSIMAINPAIAESFKNQFIPQMIYNYNYDRTFHGHDNVNVQFSVQQAGNLFWCIYEAFGKKGEKKLFGTPFSQFVKGTFQIVYGHEFVHDHWLVARAATGVAHAYGNATEVPYSEQFYVGGANSVRAFTVRSLGPGSYRPPKDIINGYFDQSGTFKFEANLEYRFPIIGILHGAVFVDTGNVWLLKADPLRPGGELKASTFLRDLALGTGCGLRVDLGMLIVRGDLGIGIHAPYDTGKSGYYNMPSFGKSLAFHLAIGYPF